MTQQFASTVDLIRVSLNLLQELCTQRRALIQQRTAFSNMTKTLTMPELVSNNNSLISELSEQIAATEQMMDALIKESPKIKVQYKILCSIPGIGPITAATLLALMPELGAIEGKQAVALAGLAPYVRQSGNCIASHDYELAGRLPLQRAREILAELKRQMAG